MFEGWVECHIRPLQQCNEQSFGIREGSWAVGSLGPSIVQKKESSDLQEIIVQDEPVVGSSQIEAHFYYYPPIQIIVADDQ
jgi:hypothetical protein